jgi:hypothetical protein
MRNFVELDRWRCWLPFLSQVRILISWRLESDCAFYGRIGNLPLYRISEPTTMGLLLNFPVTHVIPE